MYVFTKDLERLAADLESTDDEAAVVRRYEHALVAKGQVCRGPPPDLVLSCSRTLEFARALERLEKQGKIGTEAILRAARDRRIDQ